MTLPPVRGWRPTTGHERSTMALVLAAMCAAASIIGAITFVLPRVPIPDRTFQMLLTFSGLPMAGVLLVLRKRYGERLPMALFHVWLAASVVMVALGSWSARTSPTAVVATGFLVWIGLYVGNVFPWRQVVAHLVWIAACLAVLLDVNGDRASAGVGVMAFGIVALATGASYHLSVRLARLATADPLTGLPNRQALAHLLDREVERSARYGHDLCVAVVDADQFKAVNDIEGHQAGDAVLVELASHWRGGLRSVDVVARYGGDELVVVVPACDLAGACQSLDRVRRSASHPCSVGVTCWSPGDDADTVLARADRALYQAKAAGRDQIVALAATGSAPALPGANGAPTMPRARCRAR